MTEPSFPLKASINAVFSIGLAVTNLFAQGPTPSTTGPSQFERMLTPQPLAPPNGRPDPTVEASRQADYARRAAIMKGLKDRYLQAHNAAVTELSQAVEAHLKSADAAVLTRAAAARKPPFLAHLNQIEKEMPDSDGRTPLSIGVEMRMDARLVVERVKQSLTGKYPAAALQDALAIVSNAFVPTQQEAVESVKKDGNKTSVSPGKAKATAPPADPVRRNLELTLNRELPPLEEYLKGVPPDRPEVKSAMKTAYQESLVTIAKARQRYEAANQMLETSLKTATAAFTSAGTQAYTEKLLDIEFRYRREMLAIFQDSLRITTDSVIHYEGIGLKDAIDAVRHDLGAKAAPGALPIAEKVLTPPPISNDGQGTGYWYKRKTLS